MKLHDLRQGSDAWLAHRRAYFNASDAPSMMGMSPYKTRAKLLREISTGISSEVDEFTAAIYSKGHAFEANSRPMAEKLLGEDLFQVVGTEGRLSASFDGITISEEVIWEHKTLNEELKECFAKMEALEGIEDGAELGRQLPIFHRIQMEQQLHVSAAKHALFTASEWSDDGRLIDIKNCWYYPDAELRAKILTGWELFERDLREYAFPSADPITPSGRAPGALPALQIEVRGEVTASNLADFKATALAAISGVNRNLETDQDFADAEASVKWCAEVEARLDGAKQHALSQTATIDNLFRAIDEIAAEARRTRLELDRLVKARKESIREEIVLAARAALQEHAAALSSECKPAVLSVACLADFAGAIKGKRTVQSLRDACDRELVRSKTVLEDQARLIRANLAAYAALVGQHCFLFPDLSALLHKAGDDFCATVHQRIFAHQVKEELRLQAERARAISAADAPPRDPHMDGMLPPPLLPQLQACARAIESEIAAPPPGVTRNLTEICSILGFKVSADFVKDILGVPPAEKLKAARLYRGIDFERICDGLVEHIQRVRFASRIGGC